MKVLKGHQKRDAELMSDAGNVGSKESKMKYVIKNKYYRCKLFKFLALKPIMINFL